jgi:FK506-binding nuclear protein
MAAIDPSAKPLEADQPKRATLKLIRRPLDHDDYEDDDDDDDDEDESADEEELKKIQKKSKKLAKKGGSQEMDIGGDAEDSDEDEDEDDDDEEPFKTEEFVICTLDPERVSLGF